jgi:tetratricopeptide (TPR) repeat protein
LEVGKVLKDNESLTILGRQPHRAMVKHATELLLKRLISFVSNGLGLQLTEADRAQISSVALEFLKVDAGADGLRSPKVVLRTSSEAKKAIQDEDFDKALLLFEQLNTSAPKHLHNWEHDHGLALSYKGRYEEAVKQYDRYLSKNPGSVATMYNKTVALARWKGIAAASSLVKKTERAFMLLLHGEDAGRALYGLGGLKALVGDSERALSFLEKAIRNESQSAKWARHDPAWETLRTNSEFQSLLNEGQI